MKKILTALVLLAAAFQSDAQVTWGTPITVFTGSGANRHPRISLNRAGDPYLIWGKTDTLVYFSKWNGSGFTMPVVPSGSMKIFAQNWAGPDLASHGDTVYIAMKRTPETSNSNYCYLTHSYDGGATPFSTPVRIDNIDTSMSRFPIVTTTSDGNPLVAFMKFNTTFGDAKYVVSRSADFGATFSSDALASGLAGEVCDCCPASIISSGSKAILLFRNNLSNVRDIYAGVSNDAGMTFTSTFNTDNSGWVITSCPSSGPDGFVIGDTIYSVFFSNNRVYFNRASISSASSSSTPITGAITGLSQQNYPRTANAGSAAAMVWKQIISGTNTIVFSFTNNITAGFSGYSTVATGSGMANADIAMTPGAIHIVWEDDNTGKVMYMKGTYSVSTTNVANYTKTAIDINPNPAQDNFIVKLGNSSTISYSYLVDITGRHIDLFPVVVDNIATYSLTGLAKGNYFFVLVDEAGNQFYSKLQVQ